MTAPLAWLIDTNVVSEMMRPPAEPRAADFLGTTVNEGLGLASATIWEIPDGIGRLPPDPIPPTILATKRAANEGI